jgi:tripartite-type tricarboxylate transporter receptor subunit TctC
MNWKTIGAAWLAAGLALVPAVAAQAQDWPSRPIRLLVGFPPGGTIDAVARTLADALGTRLKQPVVVENRGGAAGMIAAEEASRAAPDGYTLLLNPGGPLMDKPPVDLFDDAQLTQVMRLTESPTIVAVFSGTPYRTLAELVTASKQGHGVSFASSGTGSIQHLLGEVIAQSTGAKLNHVPYRGGGQAISDLVAGHIPMGVLGAVPLTPHIQAGRVRPLAVAAKARIAALPDVPTLAEAGVPNVNLSAWTGLAAPKGLPPAVTARLVTEVGAALQDPATREKLDKLGQVVSPLDGAAFVTFARGDRDYQLRFMRERNIPLN